MKSIRLENFRCFHSKQSVPLAPLTLLVGENSTGKTSFMAMIHAMNGIMSEEHPSVSWAEPYNFNNFDQVVYKEKDKPSPNAIGGGFSLNLAEGENLQCDFVLKSIKNSPIPITTRLEHTGVWASVDVSLDENKTTALQFGTARGKWEFPLPGFSTYLWPSQISRILGMVIGGFPDDEFSSLSNSPPITNEDKESILSFLKAIESHPFHRSFAGAPIRSKPRLTYNPVSLPDDSEGTHIPTYLAELSHNNADAWKKLQSSLHDFGQSSKLFDGIVIRSFGDSQSDPFQIRIKEYVEHGEGDFRDLIDLGYGVSQILPVVTELLRQSQTPIFLLQQPEVHLHPSAQAALGSFFCDFASRGQQLVIETHSDNLIDRVRVDVRDKRTKLTTDDVLFLFFERTGPDVKIHPIRIDEMGNVVGAPDSYRQFFMDETTRSIGW